MVDKAALYVCRACEVYGFGSCCWCCASGTVKFFLEPDEHPLNAGRGALGTTPTPRVRVL